MPNYAAQSPTNPMRGLYRGDTGYAFGALTAVAIAASPTGLVRAANGIVTLTTTGNHNFVPGEVCTLADGTAAQGKIVSVGGTRFGGNYMIQATPSGTTATLLPIDDVVLHQAPDTGGAGAATSIQFENPAALTRSKAFALAEIGDMSMPPWGFFVDGLFQSAPTFELDVQVAQVDATNEYQTILNGNIVAVDATNFTFHFDAPQSGAKFVSLFMRSNTGNVGVIARIRG